MGMAGRAAYVEGVLAKDNASAWRFLYVCTARGCAASIKIACNRHKKGTAHTGSPFLVLIIS